MRVAFVSSWFSHSLSSETVYLSLGTIIASSDEILRVILPSLKVKGTFLLVCTSMASLSAIAKRI